MSRYGWGFIGITVALGILAFGLGALRELVIPLVLAAFFAVVLEPAVSWLEARRVPRSIGATIMLLVVIVLVTGAAAIVLVGIADQADEIGDRLTEAQVELKSFLEQSDVGDYVDDIRDNLGDAGAVTGSGVGAQVGTLLDSAAGFASGLVLGTILLYYLLKDGASLANTYIAGRLPDDREQIERILKQAASSIRSYFRGKTVLAFAQGLFVWIALAIMGVPLSGSVGIVNFIGAYIPFLGAFIGGAFAVLMAISEGGIGLALGALAVVLFVNLVLENVLEPKFLGSSLNLHPIVVLLSTVAGGVIAGMVGLILAAPVTSIGINLFGELKASGFFDDDDDDDDAESDDELEHEPETESRPPTEN